MSLDHRMKNQICTKFATQCQNGDAAFASHLLWCKNSCKFDLTTQNTYIRYMIIILFDAMIEK